MKRVLALYYSQTGQLRSALESFLSGLDRSEFEVHLEAIRPTPDYPFPWGFGRFLDAFPESVVGPAPALERPQFDPEKPWDLVVLGYTVWYLAPSLPVQGFLRSPHAAVLAGKPVITLVACRNMWHTASMRMKDELARLGAQLTDNVVVTDSGPAWTTFVTTPRWMLTGRKDRLWGVFPPAGVAPETIAALPRFGRAIGEKSRFLERRPVPPLLTGLGAVAIEQRFVVPELLGRTIFPPWARFVRLFGGPGSIARRPALALFALSLLLTVLVLVPVSIVLRIVLHPFLRRPLAAYVERLKAPSGVDAPFAGGHGQLETH
jgi:hypothetical protein